MPLVETLGTLSWFLKAQESNTMISTNQSTVFLLIWTNKSAPLWCWLPCLTFDSVERRQREGVVEWWPDTIINITTITIPPSVTARLCKYHSQCSLLSNDPHCPIIGGVQHRHIWIKSIKVFDISLISVHLTWKYLNCNYFLCEVDH